VVPRFEEVVLGFIISLDVFLLEEVFMKIRRYNKNNQFKYINIKINRKGEKKDGKETI